MNAENENVLSMAQTVQAFYTDNQAELDTIVPAIADQMTNLNARVDAILANGAAANLDITGFAAQKQLLEQQLVDLAHKVGNACANYYTLAVPDEGMLEGLDYNYSELNSKRDNDLYMAALSIQDIATPLSGMLDPYDASAAEILALGSAMTSYRNYIQTPQKKISKRESLLKQQDRMIADLREFFSKVLDRLIEPLRMDNRLLYDNYRAARNIIDLPGGGGNEPYVATGELMAMAKTNIALPTTEVNLFPSTPIKLRNTGEQVGLHLRFYFHNTPGGAEAATTLYKDVFCGDETTTTAADIGYNTSTGWVYLIASNGTSGDQAYRIEI